MSKITSSTHTLTQAISHSMCILLTTIVVVIVFYMFSCARTQILKLFLPSKSIQPIQLTENRFVHHTIFFLLACSFVLNMCTCSKFLCLFASQRESRAENNWKKNDNSRKKCTQTRTTIGAGRCYERHFYANGMAFNRFQSFGHFRHGKLDQNESGKLININSSLLNMDTHTYLGRKWKNNRLNFIELVLP